MDASHVAPQDVVTPVLAAALRYAEAGIAVFPTRLYVRGDGKKGVSPIGDWDSASTTDPATIREWFTGSWSDAALCIDCGKSGIVGVDQDVTEGKDGLKEWAELEHAATWRARTPTGGAHDYYRADPDHPFTVDNSGAVADGVDIRGMGGFLFAPPSIDPRGGAWQWVEGEPEWGALPAVPEVVIKRMQSAGERKRPKAGMPQILPEAPVDPLFGKPSDSFGPGGGYKKASAAGALLMARLEEFAEKRTEGSARSHFLAQNLGVLAGHGVDVFWTYEDAMGTIMQAARDNGMVGVHGEKYVADQLRRGLEYGMRELWVREPEAVPAVPGVAGRLRAAIHSRSGLRALPPLAPLIEGVIFERSIVVIAGKFGTYKTFVTAAMACSLSTGVPWMGRAVVAPVPIIYAAAEGAYGLNGRISAWEAGAGAIVPDTFHLISVPARLTRPDDVKELKELITETGAKVVVFDTFHASTPGMDENDAGSTGEVFDILRTMVHDLGITIILPHHTGHAGERARGTSSIEDDADTTFVIKLGGDGEDRRAENVRTMYHRKAKDSKTTDPIALVLKEVGESAWVRARSEFEAVAGTGEEPGWIAPTISVPDMVEAVLGEHGHDRGLTKSDVRGMVVERYYSGQSARLLKQTWGGGWNRALQRDSIVNVGGERFSADPLVIENLSE